MIDTMTKISAATQNSSLSSYCLAQLPYGIRPKFECLVSTDAYLLSSTAKFLRVGTRDVYETRLEPLVSDDPALDGMNIVVPRDFIAKLCVIV